MRALRLAVPIRQMVRMLKGESLTVNPGAAFLS